MRFEHHSWKALSVSRQCQNVHHMVVIRRVFYESRATYPWLAFDVMAGLRWQRVSFFHLPNQYQSEFWKIRFQGQERFDQFLDPFISRQSTNKANDRSFRRDSQLVTDMIGALPHFSREREPLGIN